MQVMTDQKALHLFVIGEMRTDGWKSPWRLDLERRMQEESVKPTPKPVFRAVPRTPPVRVNLDARRERLKAERRCRECPNQTEKHRSFCRPCLDKKAARMRELRADKRRRGRAQGLAPKYCTNHPDVQLNLNNKTGVCKPCYRKMRYQIEQARKP